MYLYQYKYGYGSGGLDIPPYNGSYNSAPKKSTHNIDCIDFVRWSLYEYGLAKGISSFTEKPYTTSYIPSYHSEAKSLSKGSNCAAWMQNFSVVYVSANHDTGLGRESGMTIEKIKTLLQPGDILVYTGGPRFKSTGITHGRVGDMYNNHIDVFAGFTGEDSNSSAGVLVYSCGDAPSSHSEYANGNPIAKKYSLSHSSDAHGFWDITAVIRLKV